nr:VP1-3 [Guaico Culex virus]
MMFNLISILLVVYTQLAPALTDHEQTSAPLHHRPCPPNPIDQCADLELADALLCVSCRLRSSTVNPIVVQEVIHDVVSKLPSYSSYYSIGFTTGSSTRIVAARQTHYRLDSAISITANPLSAFHKAAHYVAPEQAAKRPVLIFTDSRPDIDHLSRLLTSFNTISGTDLVRIVYKLDSETFEKMENPAYPNSAEACANYEKWLTRASASHLSTNAFILPMTAMCLKSASVHFYPIAGEYIIKNVTISGNTEPLLVANWEISAHTQVGEKPREFVITQEDFLIQEPEDRTSGSLDQEATEQNVLLLKTLHLQSSVGRIYDSITFQLLKAGGFEFMANHFMQHFSIDYFVPFLMAVYIVAISIVIYVLHSAFFLLPWFFLSGLIYCGVEGMELAHGYGAVILLLITIFRSFKKGKDIPYDDRNLYNFYHAQQHTRASTFHGSINLNVLLLLSFAILYAFSGPSIRDAITPLLPIIFIIICSTTIPGVGGNSTVGVTYLIIIIVVSYIAAPDSFMMFVKNLRDLFAPEHPPAYGSDLYTTANKILTDDVTSKIHLGINYGSLASLTRFFIGRLVSSMLVVDDILGPGLQISVASNANRRNPSPKENRGLAPLLSGTWMIPVVVQMLIDVWMGDYISFLLSVLSFFIAYFLHKYTLGQLWKARGEWLTLTNLRSDTQANPGSGPAEGRLFFLRVATTFVGAIIGYSYGINYAILLTIVSVITSQSERLTLALFSIFTWNCVGMWYAYRDTSPITGSVTRTSVAAFTPGLGENSNLGQSMPAPPYVPPPHPPSAANPPPPP